MSKARKATARAPTQAQNGRENDPLKRRDVVEGYNKLFVSQPEIEDI